MSWLNRPRLEQDVRNLGRVMRLWRAEDSSCLVTNDLSLPPGYGRCSSDLLIVLPSDYPLSPLGVAENRVYVSATLRFKGRRLRDLHEEATPPLRTPGFGPFAWLCYERVDWLPQRDNLIRFVEMLRADLTNPATHWSLL
jgi:hypothetical protein